MLALVDFSDKFRPYLSPADEIVRSGHLGWAGLPPIYGWEFYYCLTKTRLCFYTDCPLWKTQYAEVYLEDIVTTEVSKPSLFYYVIASFFSGLVHDSNQMLNDALPVAKIYGATSFEFLLWLGGYLISAAAVGISVYAILAFLFLRPTFRLAAYGGSILIETSAQGSRAMALRKIVQDVFRLRSSLRRFDIDNAF